MKLNWQRTMLIAAAAAVPGFAILGVVVLAKGKAVGPSAKLSAGSEPVGAPPRNADGMPFAAAVSREDAFRVVGRFVREQYDSRKRGRELARRTTDLIASLERLDRFPMIESAERALALNPPLRRPGERPPAADQRQTACDEGLGVFVVDQVRSGRAGVTLGEEIQDEIVRRKRSEAEAKAAEERFRALEEKQRAEAAMKTQQQQQAQSRPAAERTRGKRK